LKSVLGVTALSIEGRESSKKRREGQKFNSSRWPRDSLKTDFQQKRKGGGKEGAVHKGRTGGDARDAGVDL